MRAFLCHSHEHSEYVIEVAKYLKVLLDDGVFFYEEKQPGIFVDRISDELGKCDIMIVFAKEQLTQWQKREVNNFIALGKGDNIIVCLFSEIENFPSDLNILRSNNSVRGDMLSPKETVIEIAEYLKIPFIDNGLPSDPHIFSYEKNIIDHFVECSRLNTEPAPKEIVDKQLDGCPVKWPKVKNWFDSEESKRKISDKKESFVLAAALTQYHNPQCNDRQITGCMMQQQLCFPEAKPKFVVEREESQPYYPVNGERLRVGIVVSGGIAPGINAVIDGIVKRHQTIAARKGCLPRLTINGIRNGFLGFQFLEDALIPLDSIETTKHAGKGGSFLGTSRFDKLLDSEDRHKILSDMVIQLAALRFDILYIIGGDGSMKAAHALWTVANDLYRNKKIGRKISVIGVPKTMDNDILWVWQSFGFLSAVEKAREIIEHLGTEVESNPRLCIVQLFGSDSGFVVSHAVLASRCECDAALIPEINFSIKSLAEYLRKNMRDRAAAEKKVIPQGLVVMAETAIPTDVENFIDKERPDYINVGLNDDEETAIKDFIREREKGKRIQGQTNDDLRRAGLKIVKKGLDHLLRNTPPLPDDPDWPKLRVFTNEPRHILRAIPPSSTDIIFGSRLGMLAVDNALVGYTDFMISQWLTEYVLVPLELVVLGRKRIPNGMFWQSVQAKTGQDIAASEDKDMDKATGEPVIV